TTTASTAFSRHISSSLTKSSSSSSCYYSFPLSNTIRRITPTSSLSSSTCFCRSFSSTSTSTHSHNDTIIDAQFVDPSHSITEHDPDIESTVFENDSDDMNVMLSQIDEMLSDADQLFQEYSDQPI